MVEVSFFGRLQDVAGGASRQINLDGARTVDDLVAALTKDDARLEAELRAPTTRYVVDNEIVAGTALISDAREVGFIPPVGGG